MKFLIPLPASCPAAQKRHELARRIFFPHSFLCFVCKVCSTIAVRFWRGVGRTIYMRSTIILGRFAVLHLMNSLMHALYTSVEGGAS